MRRLTLLLSVLLSLALLVACGPVEMEELLGTADRPVDLGSTVDSGKSLGKSSGDSADYSNESGPGGWEEEEVPPVASYGVDGDLNIALLEADDSAADPDQADLDRHREIWEFIRYLLPNDILKAELRRFLIFDDGSDANLAYVEPLPDVPEKWQFAVDVGDARDMYGEEFVFTIVHEFGHIVTLRASQVPPDLSRPPSSDGQEFDEPSPEEESCETFYTGEGCANPKSYINLFYERYWDDIFDEYVRGANAAGSQEEFDDFVFDFYDKYPERFVNDYAATNPGEDIAESFATFVLEDRPAGDTIAEQKVLFFYEFAPLVSIRAHIRGRLERQSESSSLSRPEAVSHSPGPHAQTAVAA